MNQLSLMVRYEASDNILGTLLNDEEFIHVIYNYDSSKLRAILNSHRGPTPYNLTLLDTQGNKLLSIGVYVEGLATTAILTSANGTIKPIIICLKMKQP